ncbi:MAG: BON domain-containing protein [Glaciecola sp.]|jgi:osmotically-inducible protein OsmY|nr:BON domain-containing protein [Glaciecola sp.]MDG1815852.1 BON domain-containing protein [Glaciecola sp.]MDG2100060.1 BON domain-containing protein [Glaciecola sp.]
MRRSNRHMLMGVIALSCVGLTTGCTAIALGTVATIGATASQDPRSIGTQIDDTNAVARISLRLSEIEGLSDVSDIEVDVFNRQLLLTGTIDDESWQPKINAVLAADPYLRKTHNQVRVGLRLSTSMQAKDILIANALRAKLLVNDEIESNRINVVVNGGDVFLMGLLDNQQATRAVEIARNINNVKSVVRVFEIIQ